MVKIYLLYFQVNLIIFIGDAVCDGGAITWEYKKKSDILSNLPDPSTVTTQKLEELEMDRMRFNAFQVQLILYCIFVLCG